MKIISVNLKIILMLSLKDNLFLDHFTNRQNEVYPCFSIAGAKRKTGKKSVFCQRRAARVVVLLTQTWK